MNRRAPCVIYCRRCRLTLTASGMLEHMADHPAEVLRGADARACRATHELNERMARRRAAAPKAKRKSPDVAPDERRRIFEAGRREGLAVGEDRARHNYLNALHRLLERFGVAINHAAVGEVFDGTPPRAAPGMVAVSITERRGNHGTQVG